MLPEANTKHVEEARALLIGQYKGKEVIQGFLDSYVRRLQDVEDVLWDIIDARILADATGVQLDTLGDLVGEIRRERSDEEYRVGIRIKIRVNRSKGRIVDIIEIASLANDPGEPVVEEHRYLNFHVETYEQVGERFLADYLTRARAASSYGCLVASDLPEEELLRFDDEEDPDAAIETFSDAESGQGKLAASCYGLPSDFSGVVLAGDPTAMPAPRVDWLEESEGVEDDVVIIHGAYFTGATAVDFGATAAKSFTVVNDARISAVVPAYGGIDDVDVEVTTPHGTDTGEFSYLVVSEPEELLTEGGETMLTEAGEDLTTEG